MERNAIFIPQTRFWLDSRRHGVFPIIHSNLYSYYDGQSNDARLSTIITRTAIDEGAVAVNYAEVTDLLHSSQPDRFGYKPIQGVRARDTLTGKELTIHATVTVNATGPYVDTILKMYDIIERGEEAANEYKNVIIPSKGVHLLVRGSYCHRTTGLVTLTSDKRVIFMLPWQN